ncbi:MAG: peptidylprolyl isomerase [Aureispira sp.]
MALLGTIRNRFGWLMMGVIFVGIASFLFMDISPGNSLPQAGGATVGYINGEKVTNDMVREYSEDYKGQGYLNEEVQKDVWDRIIGEKLLLQKTEEAGMMVSPVEMGDLFVSDRPELLSSIVVQRLGDPQTRQVNVQQVKQTMDFMKNTGEIIAQTKDNPSQRASALEQQQQWFALERAVKVKSLQDKYFIALEKGIYTPSWLAELDNTIEETSYNFDYVRVPYTNVTDAIEITDQAIQGYIQDNPKAYEREATASIEYVTFDVIPTAEDSSVYRQELLEVAEDMGKATNIKEDSLVIQRNYGTFAANYYTKDELSVPASLKDSLLNAPDGTVFGPYVEQKQFKILKKIESKQLPDSVQARHILIRATDPTAGQAARKTLDSLKAVLEEDPNASFDSLALQFSQDGSRTQGGDLGWKAKDGSFVPQFEEYMFYTGKEDAYDIIYTQFGVHLIQITGYKFENNKKGIRIATVSRDIIPSSKTTSDIKRTALEFIANNRTLEEMKASARENGLNPVPAIGLEEGSFTISGLGKSSTAAEIIRWAHEGTTETNEVTNQAYVVEDEALNYTKQFVVAALTSRTKAGLASIEDPQVRGDVDRILRNEKKVELVQAKAGTAGSLDGLAGEYGVVKESALAVKYGSANVGTVGAEPKVAAMAAGTALGTVSKAVGGREGVYVLEVLSKNDAPAITDAETARDKTSQRIARVVSAGVYQSMKDGADIIDDRQQY